MKLQDILYKVNIKSVVGNTSIEVNALQIDSRKVVDGNTFIALKGTLNDGHSFIEAVIEKGASVIVCEIFPKTINPKIVYVQVENTEIAAGIMSSNFFENPSSKINLIGITGTNGKTTVATLLFNLFTALEYKCGLISTVQNQIANVCSLGHW